MESALSLLSEDCRFVAAERAAARAVGGLVAVLAAIMVGVLPASSQPETAPLVVMNLAAHPDDEDGTTLAYYRHAKDAVAYSVIFTRGEGGQNEIGPELYEELGAIRTRETERAARRLGTQVHFLNFKDFGYSKSAEETFETWGGRDEVTAQLVYLIRRLKPDVLFTNHDTVTVGSVRQHGHHQAVGLSAFDAFELAADPSYHPEHLEEPGVDLWQPKRLFRRLWTSDGEHDVAVPVGADAGAGTGTDHERGRTYAAIAADALYEHASQGMDRFAERIREWTHTYFDVVRSHGDVPTGSDDLAAGLEPNRSAEPDITYWIDSGRIDPLPAGALTVNDSVYVPGQSIEINWNASLLPKLPIRLTFFGVADTSLVVRPDTPSPARLPIPAQFQPTMPERIYQYARTRNHPPVGYTAIDVRSEELLAAGYIDVGIAPAILLEPEADVVRLKPGLNTVKFSVRTFDPAIESLNLTTALSHDGDRTVLDQHRRAIALTADETHIDSTVVRLGADAEAGAYTIAFSGLAENATLGSSPVSTFLPARVFDVLVPSGLRVGVVESYDNTLDRALVELGVEHRLLDSLDLASARFDDLHTIVIDIRAYLVREDLRLHNAELLDWVRQGGHLVVNYHKTFEWNTESQQSAGTNGNDSGNFAPYPLQLGRERVTREDAPVKVLKTEHPIFNEPNELGSETWDGWVQERGLYFPDEYDRRYEELVSLHDPDEAPLESSTLFTTYGSGTYLYTALVWYRQLKEFHPGAYRAFANMISLPLVDARRGSR